MHKVSYVLTERFCQDPLENYFGKQRSSGARKDNPSLYDFGYNDNTIRNQKVFKPIATSNLHDEYINFEIDTEPVSCRKKYKQSKLYNHRKPRAAIRYLNYYLNQPKKNSCFDNYRLTAILKATLQKKHWHSKKLRSADKGTTKVS